MKSQMSKTSKEAKANAAFAVFVIVSLFLIWRCA